MLIDTGEEENVLIEYLLDRKIRKIDYLLISHFDSDHCLNAIELLEKLKVKNIIISKQKIKTDEFEEIIQLAQNKKVNIIQVKEGNVIEIDKDIQIKIFWPSNNLSDNQNNNSIVAKLEYNKFSILFTGDIEREAEKEIISKYADELKSTVLKVSHHGSKTSTTEAFLGIVKPQIALIGVGNNNKFGHPSNEIINRLEENKVKIYRTDKMGEITIKINKKGSIKLKTYV